MNYIKMVTYSFLISRCPTANIRTSIYSDNRQ